MKTRAVIFDLGNTLVDYWPNDRWPAILGEAIESVTECLRSWQMLRVGHDERDAAVAEARGGREDHAVYPLIDRLRTIFRLTPKETDESMSAELEAAFCRPIFRYARPCADTPETLTALRERGLKLGVLSNSPWGSPPGLWRRELHRLRLTPLLDAAVFCGEVGYRKPHRAPFEAVCERLGVTTGECLFVGDDERWDIAGPRAIGMDAVLIDRTDAPTPPDTKRIRALTEVLDLVPAQAHPGA